MEREGAYTPQQVMIILHAGGENGWIEGTDLVFQSKKTTGDYHDEMNFKQFEVWFRDHLKRCTQQTPVMAITPLLVKYHIYNHHALRPTVLGLSDYKCDNAKVCDITQRCYII